MLTRKLFFLAVFYFVQGLPYGFQIMALPVYLRIEGVSLAGIGLASALALPWAFKLFWGPPVDHFGSARLGRRKSWILPLQLALCGACLAGAFVPPDSELRLLVLVVLLMNLFAATMDVAVDGLAIDLLESKELGYGNITQVVGYKLGMLTGGGALVWASGQIGWRGVFYAMAALVFLAFLITLAFREPACGSGAPHRQQPSIREVLALLSRALKVPGAAWLVLFIATYKLGESMADSMFKPFLYDSGFTAEEIGLWVGTWGMVFSLAGSFLGGILASRWGLLRTLAVTAALRGLAVGGEWWLVLIGTTTGKVIGVVAAEQFFGGALTTATFAYMMSRVDRRIGATHYTMLATVEVMGKLGASWASGFIAEQMSYAVLFGLATSVSLLFLLLLIPLHRELRPSPIVSR